jgi:hypothetical protein
VLKNVNLRGHGSLVIDVDLHHEFGGNQDFSLNGASSPPLKISPLDPDPPPSEQPLFPLLHRCVWGGSQREGGLPLEENRGRVVIKRGLFSAAESAEIY